MGRARSLAVVVVALSATAVIVVSASLGATGYTKGTIAIPAMANIFGAGLSSPPAPAGHGAGTLPPLIRLPKGQKRTLIISSITGQVTCCDTENPVPYNGWEGDSASGTDLYPQGSIGGVHGPRRMFLVGVFLTSEHPAGAPPTGDSNHAPELAQPFAVRPGSKVVIPSYATRLFLGFGDGYAFQGEDGYYSDNAGSLQMVYKIYVAPPVCPVTDIPSKGKQIQVGNVVYLKSRKPQAGYPIRAFVRHGAGAPLKPLHEGDAIRKGDIVSTDQNTILAFRFAVGGEVHLNTSAKIKVTSERTLVDVGGGLKISEKSLSSLWAKCNKLKEPVEIQKDGGIMGIRG